MADGVSVSELAVRATLDANGYAAGAATKVAADQRMTQSDAILAASAERTERRIASSARQFETLQRQIDPAYRAQRLYEQGLKTLTSEFERGRVSGERFADLQNGLAQKYGSAAQGLGINTAAQQKLATELEQSERVFASLQARINPATLAYERFGREAGALDTLLKNGRITVTQYDEALGHLATELDKVGAKQLPGAAAPATTGVQQSLDRRLGVKAPEAGQGNARASAEAIEKQLKIREAAQKSATEIKDALDPAAAAQRKYGEEVKRVQDLTAAGLLTDDQQTQYLTRYQGALDEQAKSLGKAHGANGGFLAGLRTNQQSLAEAEHSVRAFSDSLIAGQPPLKALGQEAPRVLQALSGLGPGVLPIAAGILALAVALGLAIVPIVSYQVELKKFDAALKTTGRTVGLSRDGLLDLAHASAEAARITQSEGRTIALSLAQTGEFSAATLGKAIALSRDFGSALGLDATKGAEALAQKLADPSKGLIELGQSFGIADAGLVRYVQDLQAQGREEEARSAILDRLGPKIQGLADHELTAFGRAWKAVADSVGAAYEGIAKIGSQETDTDKIERLIELINRFSNGRQFNADLGPVPEEAYDGIVKGARSQLGAVFNNRAEKGIAADESARVEKARQASATAVDLADQYDKLGGSTRTLTNENGKLVKALADLRASGSDDIALQARLERAIGQTATASKSQYSAHERDSQILKDQAQVLAAGIGQRQILAATLQAQAQKEEELAHLAETGKTAAEVEIEYQGRVALASLQVRTAISDEAAAIRARIDAQDALAAGIRQGPVQAAFTRAKFAGDEALRTGRALDPDAFAQQTLDSGAADESVKGAEAVARLRREVDLLAASSRITTLEQKAFARAQQEAAQFTEPLAEAQAALRLATERGDGGAARSAAGRVKGLQDEAAAYGHLLARKDELEAQTGSAQRTRDLEAQLSLVQEQAALSGLKFGNGDAGAVDYSRQIAQLQERNRLQREYGDVLGDEQQRQIALAGEIAATQEKSRLADQERSKEAQQTGRAFKEIGSASVNALEQLTQSTNGFGANLSQVFGGLADEIEKIILKILVFEPLEGELTRALGGGAGSGNGAVGGLFGGGGGGGLFSGLGSLFNGTPDLSNVDANIAGAASGTLPTSGGLLSEIGGLFGFAGGGIMSGLGQVPLRTYAGGGVTRSPQLALFGEGSTPEAFVPVPSGRIPVEMRGMPGGGVGKIMSSVINNITINGSSGTPDQNADLVNQMAEKLPAVIDQRIYQAMRKEMRSGGLLRQG